MFPGCPTPTNCPWDAKDVKKENKTLIFKPISNYVYYITKDTGILRPLRSWMKFCVNFHSGLYKNSTVSGFIQTGILDKV